VVRHKTDGGIKEKNLTLTLEENIVVGGNGGALDNGDRIGDCGRCVVDAEHGRTRTGVAGAEESAGLDGRRRAAGDARPELDEGSRAPAWMRARADMESWTCGRSRSDDGVLWGRNAGQRRQHGRERKEDQEGV
jgi:hypothetical protein